ETEGRADRTTQRAVAHQCGQSDGCTAPERESGKPRLDRAKKDFRVTGGQGFQEAIAVGGEAPQGRLGHMPTRKVLNNPRPFIVVRCLPCQHRGFVSERELVRFGIKPGTPVAQFVKRLRCRKCGSGSVMAQRTTSKSVA